MKRKFSITISIIIPFLIWGCNHFGGGLSEDVIAEVNGEEIKVKEFDLELKDLILGKEMEVNREQIKELRKAYLDQVIERRLILQEAKRIGIEVSRGELDLAIEEIKKDYLEEELREKLLLKGINLEQWKINLEERLLAEKMIQRARRYEGKIDEREILEYYETHRTSFQIPLRVRVRQIVVSDEQEALNILRQLKKGAKFEKIAKEKSLGPERIYGGDLGYFSQGEKPSQFDHVFGMEVGSISKVVKSPYGYHIFKLEERIESRQIPFQEARSRIIEELLQRKGEKKYEEWLRGIKGKAKIKINKKWFRS